MARKSSLYDQARGTAFKAIPRVAPTVDHVETRVRHGAVTLLALMPGALGAIALAAALGRSGPSDGAFPLAIAALLISASLLALGRWSRLSADRELLSVRFFGLRSTTMRFDAAVAATFGMTFPSISFGVTLKDRLGRRVVVHANWWRDEEVVIAFVCRRLLEHDVALDRATANIVARTLAVPRPAARIVHRPLLRKDRTF
jgi:hypothetical protein